MNVNQGHYNVECLLVTLKKNTVLTKKKKLYIWQWFN